MKAANMLATSKTWLLKTSGFILLTISSWFSEDALTFVASQDGNSYRHEIKRYIKSDFVFSLCESSEFNDLLTNSFSINNTNSDISEELTDEFDLQSFAGSISATEDLLSGTNDTPIIKLINGIISQAVKSRASDIHFEPYEDHLVVRFRVDGILNEILRQDSKISSVLISRIKIISGLDISERRLPQDGRVSLSLASNT